MKKKCNICKGITTQKPYHLTALQVGENIYFGVYSTCNTCGTKQSHIIEKDEFDHLYFKRNKR